MSRLVLWPALYLVLLISLQVGICRREEACIDAEASLTSSGLILLSDVGSMAHSAFVGRVLKVVDRVETLSDCQELEFKNAEGFDDNTSAGVHNPKFSKIAGKTANGHAVYGNGKDFLSFIKKEVGGSWIVGAVPGEDRGYAYASIEYQGSTPAGVSGWYWLRQEDWEQRVDVSVECTSGPVSSRLYTVDLINDDGTLERGTVNESDEKLTLELSGVRIEVTEAKNLYEVGDEVVLPGGEGEGTLSKIEDVRGDKKWDLIFNLKDGGDGRVSVPATLRGDQADGTLSRVLSSKEGGEGPGGTMRAAREGQYLWAFYEGPMLPHRSTLAAVVAIREVLLLCVSPGVFKAFPSDRMDAMQQEPLSADVDLLVSSGALLTGPEGQSVRLTSCRNLGTADEVVRGLWTHLAAVDRQSSESPDRVATTPACFFYHSSITLPASLVYAAEIVCLVMGAKPVVMIQYATPSEHQWKFPLVQALVRAVTATIYSEGERSALGLKVFSYRRDKTLVLFNRRREYLVDALAPTHQSQGLHPVPYPDEAAGGPQLREDHRLQVHNSFWNGYVLGYPLRFVTVYCEDFHNPLTREHRRRIADDAHTSVREHFRRGGLEAVEIGMGLDSPLSAASLEAVYRSIAGV